MPKETIIQNNCAVWPQQHPHYPPVLPSSPESLPVPSLSQRRMCRQGHGRSHNDKHVPVTVTWVFNSAHQKHPLFNFHVPLVVKREDKFPISSFSGQIRKGLSVWNIGTVSWGLVDPILNPIQEGESPPLPAACHHPTQHTAAQHEHRQAAVEQGSRKGNPAHPQKPGFGTLWESSI